jgi:hypothetical protein
MAFLCCSDENFRVLVYLRSNTEEGRFLVMPAQEIQKLWGKFGGSVIKSKGDDPLLHLWIADVAFQKPVKVQVGHSEKSDKAKKHQRNKIHPDFPFKKTDGEG